MLEHVIE